MAQEEPTTRERQARHTTEDLERFDRLMIDAVDKPWWRDLIKEIYGRRDILLLSLVDGVLDQRHEDRLRGQISELNFMITMDERAKGLKEAKEESRNGRPNR